MDWVAFLTDHDIAFVTRGPRTKRGELSIKCPWCGDDDQAEHLGISLTKEAWACWRHAQHCGHAPHTLIQALLGTSYAQARLTVNAYSATDPTDLDTALIALQGVATHTAAGPPPPQQTMANLTNEAPRAVAGPLPRVAWPPEAQAIKNSGGTARFWRYLKGRRFDDVDDLVARYHLKCATTGVQKDRVIIPLFQKRQLIGWTGRAIQPTVNAPRYLSSGEAVKQVIFNEDDVLDGGKLLFVVEGPFDALKLDYYGEPVGVRSTCLFGVTMTMAQLVTLRTARRHYKRVVILLDRAAIEPAFDALDWLAGPNVTIGTLPDGVKDPGELRGEDVERLIKEYIQ